jgi:hypothetical protein
MLTNAQRNDMIGIILNGCAVIAKLVGDFQGRTLSQPAELEQ